MTPPARLARLRHRVVTDLWTRPANNFAALDGLRGFAPVILVFYHCTIFTGVYSPPHPSLELRVLQVLANGFWTGVDIFFVLSGFLIGRILINELLVDGKIHYGKFYLRRFFRIFPAYYLILTVSLLVITPFNVGSFLTFVGTRSWQELWQRAWSNYLYVSNYAYPGRPNLLTWGWSLCVEEHFYLLLPALLALTFRVRSASIRMTLLIAYVLLPFLSRGIQHILDPSIVLMKTFYYYSHNRFDEIFAGVLIANLYVVHRETFERVTRQLGWIVPAAGIGCVLAVWIFGGLQFSHGFAIVGQFLVIAIGTGLLLINGLFLDNRVARFFRSPFWYPLSRVSYGTYLIHPFVLFWWITFFRTDLHLRQINAPSLFGLYAVVMSISTLLACIMFLVMERPLLDAGVRIAKRLARTGTDGD
jgi:peptidoglycan/LPS O-acetylase OafA/YrhL